MMVKPERQSDCSRCAALCCIAFPAGDMPGFSASKQAGEPCPKLDSCGRCTIYDRREQEGFRGCIAFECFGAGQHVVQHLYSGRDWRDDPALLAPMSASFLAVRKGFELLYLVDWARSRGPGPDIEAQLDRAEAELLELVAQREASPHAAVTDRIDRELRDLFAELGRPGG